MFASSRDLELLILLVYLLKIIEIVGNQALQIRKKLGAWP